MKKKYLLVLFSISILALCDAQEYTWIPQGQDILPDGYGIIDLSVVDDSTVWALAYPTFIYFNNVDTMPDAVIIKSVNGGDDWDVYMFSDIAFYSLSAVSGEIAWASVVDEQNDDSYLYQTTNGGESWELKHTLFDIGAPALKFTDIDKGYWTNTGYSGNTPDGGTTWNQYDITIPSTTNEYFSYVSVQNWMEAKGDTLLYGTNKRIYRSIDGGEVWDTVLTFDGNHEITSVAFDDAGNGLAISDFDVPPFPASADNFRDYTVVWKSNNFGATWEMAPNAPFPLSVVTHVPGEENTFFAVSGVYNWIDDPLVELSWASAYTTDGGMTWETIDRDIPYTCIGFASINAGWVGAVGNFDYGPDDPAVFKLEKIIVNTENPVLESGITISPNPFTDYIHLKSEQYQIEYIECFNAQGQQMAMLSADELEMYNFTKFPSGIYFLEIHTKEGSVIKKVVKN